VNKETIIMGNSALAEELVGTKEIDELHKLDASRATRRTRATRKTTRTTRTNSLW
jgi:hypothetical protein